MLKTQGKLAARKQLYYSIAQMLEDHMRKLEMHTKVLGTMLARWDEVNENCVPPSMTGQQAMDALIENAMNDIVPAYRMFVALKNYHEAFGEFPEFASFIERNKLGKTTEERLSSLSKIQESLNRTAILLAPGMKGKTIHQLAFGGDYLKACENTKIKGEK